MPPGHVHELRITARGPNRQRMTDCPNRQPGDPEAKAEADRAGERAVDDGERARGAAEQYQRGDGASAKVAVSSEGIPSALPSENA